MLPEDAKPGSVIKITLAKDNEEEEKRDREIDKISQKIVKGLQ